LFATSLHVDYKYLKIFIVVIITHFSILAPNFCGISWLSTCFGGQSNQRARRVGNLINEEAFLFARYLKKTSMSATEQKTWASSSKKASQNNKKEMLTWIK